MSVSNVLSIFVVSTTLAFMAGWLIKSYREVGSVLLLSAIIGATSIVYSQPAWVQASVFTFIFGLFVFGVLRKKHISLKKKDSRTSVPETIHATATFDVAKDQRGLEQPTFI